MANTTPRKTVTTVDSALVTAEAAAPTTPPTPVSTNLTALVMVVFQSKSVPGTARFISLSSSPIWNFSSSQV